MKTFLTALRVLFVLTILTGIVYPVLMTAFAEAVFPSQADGSLLVRSGKIVGSRLLAQKNTDPGLFWPRPSAADYATVASGASNQGILSQTLGDAVQARRAALAQPATNNIPADLLQASGSGLDPHISPEAARYQIDRVAAARTLDPRQKEALQRLVEEAIEPPQFGLLGEPRVNVLLLNLRLAKLQTQQP